MTDRPSPIRNGLRLAQYSVGQSAKVGWYTAQYLASRHAAGPFTSPGRVPRPYRARPAPPREVRRAFFRLFAEEAADIAAGRYRVPADLRTPPDLRALLAQARRYYEEAGTISRRAHRRGGAVETRKIAPAGLPSYYVQNFHFQSDGWLSDPSAEIYDTQVESLFTGAADTMRRRGLPLLLDEIDRVAGEEGRAPVLVDIGCGTGRLLADCLVNRPHVDAFGLDLSTAYLRVARNHVGRDRAAFIQAPAEQLPFADHSVDILFSVYLFHELPAKVRERVAAEFSRVLKPGGYYLHIDSVQYGDTAMDIMLEGFPRAVHEPYYDAYCRQDLDALFASGGFARVEGDERIAFLTKVTPYRRCEA
ncbi:class I SAM-dependent methyltransferase [Parvularcula bermudensis]|uniref:class I SAM-dependent methyltransferase n=1 Tax=Parvularcula bermudensis TaxID=208216 RepID=UPI0006746732|nr:class I SAM-dependent methyltransferase [Parvularcula bermudensis]